MIGVLDYSIGQLEKKFKEEIERAEEKETLLNEETIDNIINILSDNELRDIIKDITRPDYYKNLDYKELIKLHEVIGKIYDKLNEVKDRYDVDVFLKDGNILDYKTLKEEYNKNSKIKDQYPNADLKKLCELYKKPPKTLKTYYNNDEILIDSFVFRKFMLAILQMVMNEMDLVNVYVGGEGTGKSSKASQDMYMVYWILTELKLITYQFKIKETFFNSLSSLHDTEDKYFKEKMRILCLDEGNELNRQNWREPNVATFFYRLRRERINQRIKFICLPVLGELITNIVLSRVNFVFEMKTKNIVKTGLLQKGKVNFYVIPRGDKIYSPLQKREIYTSDIKNILYENLKDKSYLRGMPKELIVHTFTCNGVWGFPHSEYIKNLKDTNETFTVNKGLSLSEWELYCIYRTNISLKKQGVSHKDWNYHTTAKLLIKINNYFEKNPDLLGKYKAIEERKNG